MKNTALFIFLLLASPMLWAQQNTPIVQKYALVIGNGAYNNITKLNNPVNDANDVAAALQGLGFTVDKVLNGTLDQMEAAVIRLKARLGSAKSTYGFLFYAGHGVQSNGENYLIPVDANIQSESFLRQRAVSVQVMLDELNSAENELNVVVLDACRDNPFSWRRSGSRGLTLVANQPADSIIVYATAAGSTAADGTGRNGLFTEQFLKNLKTPGLEVNEVFRLTMGDVVRVSNNQQRPSIYNQFPGTAYLGTRPTVFDQGSINIATGSLEISTITAGSLEIRGGTINQKADLPAWGTLPIPRINAGTYDVTMRYTDGKVEQRSVEVGCSESKKVEFTYRVALQPAPANIVPETVATGTLSVSSLSSGKIQIPTASGIQYNAVDTLYNVKSVAGKLSGKNNIQ